QANSSCSTSLHCAPAHTNPKRKRGRKTNLPSLTLRVSVRRAAAQLRGWCAMRVRGHRCGASEMLERSLPTEQSDHFLPNWCACGSPADKPKQSVFHRARATTSIPAPHFPLFSEARGKKRQGEWRFVLQAA